MMKKYKNIWIAVVLLNLVVLLFSYNQSIAGKEAILQNGQLALLELAPVDPRSLMQGDYMRLNYRINRILSQEANRHISKTGYCILKLDDNNVATLVRIQDDLQPLSPGEYAIRYHGSEFNKSIGQDSYFFQEGKADVFQTAKYGGLKVDNNANSVLEGLYNEAFEKIE